MNRFFTRPSLSRDFAFMAAAIFGVMLLVSLWVAYETYLSYAENISKDLEVEGARIDRTLVIEIENASYLIESLARQMTYHGTEDLTYTAKLLKSFDLNATIHNVFSWIDENQYNVVSSNRGVLDKPIDVSDRDFVKKSLAEPWKIQIGRPMEGRVSKKWVIPVAMGLTDDTGKFIGTILISLDISALTEKISRAVDRPGISFALTTSTFAKITEHSTIANFMETYFPREKLLQLDLAQKPSGVFAKGRPFDTGRMYTFYEASSKYPFTILLGYDGQVGQGVLWSILLPRLVQIAIVTGFLIAMLWLIRVRVMRPVEHLTEAAAHMARGEAVVLTESAAPAEINALVQQLRKVGDYLGERVRIEDELQHKIQMLRRAKETAELTNQIKVEFLASMSQELRTPLNTIVAFSEVMKNQYYGPIQNEKYLQYSQDIHKSGQQLLEVINDVLALAQVEAGMLDLKEKPIRLPVMLNKCLRLIQEKLHQSGVSVRLQLADGLPKLLMDELRIKQIILNLLTYCLKSTPAGGEILVEARLDNDRKGNAQLLLSFRGTGTPITPAVETTRSSSQGAVDITFKRGKTDLGGFAGISIPVSKTLAAMHQAELYVETIAGRGPNVILRFPKERLVFWEQQAN